VIIIHARDTVTGRERKVEIPVEHAPALRSAIAELRNLLGERSKGTFLFKKEHALSRAIAALGSLAAPLNHVIAEEDRDYDWR
jgi:hypothetical protein